MTKTMYKIYRTMLPMKKGVSKKELQNLTAISGKDFDEAWKGMRTKNILLVTRRKTFVLNGTTLAATMSLENRLAS